jgi:glycosyltransferase involved in cell wall biosynthesis
MTDGIAVFQSSPRREQVVPVSPDLVTVVVPARDAARTIDETLRSVRAQTHRDLEVLVVDDGSSDDTPDIAALHAREDGRIRLISQSSCGVAAARNRGITEARGGIIAPIDADDLWRSDKIARHAEVFRARGPRVALVYDWYATIDEQSNVLWTSERSSVEGDVLRRMCGGNLLGNGSCATMRRSAVLEAGGYDPSLRARNAQGCEDWKLHLLIAERYDFGHVPEVLTGYRLLQDSMSGDVLQMMRCYDIVGEHVRSRHPEFIPEFERGRSEHLRWLASRAVRAGRFGAGAVLIRRLLESDTRVGLEVLASLPAAVARRLARKLVPGLARPHRIRFPADQGGSAAGGAAGDG